jgi:hypothetical protein
VKRREHCLETYLEVAKSRLIPEDSLRQPFVHVEVFSEDEFDRGDRALTF